MAIASDHAGYKLKKYLITSLSNKDVSFLDLGTNDSEISVDYPDYAAKVVESISVEEADFGILICASGIGMSIAANRRSDIRAALCTSLFMAERARLHNNANILVLGAENTTLEGALSITEKFLKTSFEGGRHSVRLSKIR